MKKSMKSLLMVGLSLFIGFGVVGCGEEDTQTYSDTFTNTEEVQKNHPDLKDAHELFLVSMEDEAAKQGAGALLEGMNVESKGDTVTLRMSFSNDEINYELMNGLWRNDVEIWRDASEQWRMAFDAYGYTEINFVVELYAENNELLLVCENGYVTFDAFMETDTF